MTECGVGAMVTGAEKARLQGSYLDGAAEYLQPWKTWCSHLTLTHDEFPRLGEVDR